MVCVCLLPQGVALGYVVLPLRGVQLATFDTPSLLRLERITDCEVQALAVLKTVEIVEAVSIWQV